MAHATGKQLIVVTDLDGTLLDHHSYGYEAARPALDALARLDIPLVLNSSKTAAEILALRRELGNREPFVTENGGGLCVPRRAAGEEGLDTVVLGRARADILAALNELRRERGWRFTGFADMPAVEIARLTGLRLDEAENARRRDFSEPLLWQDSEDAFAEFTETLRRSGFSVQRGGRFVHVAGRSDKGAALPWLRRHFADRGAPPTIIALGDGDNDRAMLEAADHAVLVRSPVNAPPQVDHPRLRVTGAEGPRGWNAAVLALLAELRAGADKE